MHNGVHMAHNLSIRNLPLNLEKAIQKEAKKNNTTKTEVVLTALNSFFNLDQKPKRVQRDIRSFFGQMTLKDYQEFQKQTQDFSSIDEEMWR